jgi:hypothetical protein
MPAQPWAISARNNVVTLLMHHSAYSTTILQA